MIIRQLVVRHGRSAATSSSTTPKLLLRTYANEIPSTSPVLTRDSHERQASITDTGPGPKPQSILDTTSLPPTATTRALNTHLEAAAESQRVLEAEIHALSAARNSGTIPNPKPTSYSAQAPPPAPFSSLPSFHTSRALTRAHKTANLDPQTTYKPWEIFERPPRAAQLTLPTLLANQTHLGHATSLWNPANSAYIHGIRDGIHIISLDITLSYLRRAAKVIKEVAKRGGMILFVGTRKGHQQIVVNSARIARPAYHIFSRWTPGTLTNGQQILNDCAVKVVNVKDQTINSHTESLAGAVHPVLRPDLVVCLNPIENEVCLHECGLYNVPTVGIVDTDADPSWVTYPIPANDDSLRSVALVSGALAMAAREGQMERLGAAERGEVTYDKRVVAKFLKDVEDLASFSVSSGGGSKDEKGDD